MVEKEKEHICMFHVRRKTYTPERGPMVPPGTVYQGPLVELDLEIKKLPDGGWRTYQQSVCSPHFPIWVSHFFNLRFEGMIFRKIISPGLFWEDICVKAGV